MFIKDSDGNLRMIDRREGDKQVVIALGFWSILILVFSALAVNDLRGSGFAGYRIRGRITSVKKPNAVPPAFMTTCCIAEMTKFQMEGSSNVTIFCGG